MAKAKKLPSGSWRVQASKSINGKMVKKSFTANSKKEAEYMAAEWQLKSEESNTVKNITLLEAYNKYIEMRSGVLSPSTIRGYEALRDNTFTEIMNFPISKLTETIIQMEISNLAAKKSAKYVHNAYGLLKAVLKVFKVRLDLENLITLPQKKKPELNVPDDDVIKLLLNAAKGKKIEIPILLAAFGPMRRGEICALTSDDITGNIVTVNKAYVLTPENEWILKDPKSYEGSRYIEYPDFVIEKLKNIKGNITEMSPSAITDAFPKLLKKYDLPKFRFHDLRHYAVSTLHAINVPDKYIMARGGWATNDVMQRVYNHTLQSKSDELTKRITTHFNTVYDNETQSTSHETHHENETSA